MSSLNLEILSLWKCNRSRFVMQSVVYRIGLRVLVFWCSVSICGVVYLVYLLCLFSEGLVEWDYPADKLCMLKKRYNDPKKYWANYQTSFAQNKLFYFITFLATFNLVPKWFLVDAWSQSILVFILNIYFCPLHLIDYNIMAFAHEIRFNGIVHQKWKLS